MLLADIIGISANLAFLLLLFVPLLSIFMKNTIIKLVLMIIFSILVLFIHAYHGMTIIEITRGVIGDLSISGLLFTILFAVVYFTKIPVNIFERSFCLSIVLIGVALYLSTIDIIPLDVYRFGYLPNSLLVVVMILCMLFLFVNPVFALIWLIALIAFLLKLQNSVNLFDYLIDPILWLLCFYKLLFNTNKIVT